MELALKKIGDVSELDRLLSPLLDLYISSDRKTRRAIKVILLERLERFA